MDAIGFRLKQDPTLKLTLQTFLAVMVLGAGLAYTWTRLRHTLPHNPCLIAGAMSLLAGIELVCDRKAITAGSEWLTGKELG